jgi:ribonuclease-3
MSYVKDKLAKKEVKKPLEKTLDYHFHNSSLLAEALTHSSLRRKKSNNERLEFLGDRVLGLVIANALFHRFPEAKEGELAARQAHLISREVLSQIGEKLNLGENLQTTKGERAGGSIQNKSLIADACEALIAALYLDGGFEIAENFILTYWSDELKASDTLERDAKSLLQEWAQGHGKPPPIYNVLNQTGPHHAPSFEIGVQVRGFEMVIGKGASKREAEQSAAKALLQIVRGLNA